MLLTFPEFFLLGEYNYLQWAFYCSKAHLGISQGAHLSKSQYIAKLSPLLDITHPQRRHYTYCCWLSIPVASENCWKHFIRVWTDTLSPLAKSRKSSAKHNSVLPSLSHFGWKLKSGRFFMTITNKSGETRSPCLIPRVTLRYGSHH